MVDCPGSAPLGGPTDEEECRTWSSWGPWSSCSTSCGTGSVSRQRTCPPGDPLHHCQGQDVQRQQCFNTTCPGKELHKKKNQTFESNHSPSVLTNVAVAPLQSMVSGCHGLTGPTVPAVVVECRSDTEAASLLAMEAETVPSSPDLPTSPWKSVRTACKLQFKRNECLTLNN